MQKGKTLKQVNKSYHARMKALTKAGREKEILLALSNGKNSYMRIDRLESSSFDSSWIDEIEGVIFDLGEIIANPRMNTKTEGNIVPVELARKTSAESVQHLASHTQYVKEIDEYGNVIPSKILTMIHDDDIKTYENRFIATFVRRLILFIEKRYEFVSKFAELHDESILMFKNKSFVEGAEVEIETKIRINHKSDDELSLKSNAYVERIKEMRQYILYFYNSPFMKQMKTEKDVHNPILQTNIIRKNPLYHHCYEVYRFIERYEHLGVHYKMDEHFSLFNDEELKEINRTLFANYITLHGKERSKNAKSSSKVYKPKILTSIDDEQFVYGPLFEGPIEFLRIDEPYQKYLDSKVRKDLPIHPTKREKEYYAEEYAAKAENKEDLKQKDDLIKRKTKEINAFNKWAAKIDEEREAARLKLLQMEKEVIQKEEDDLLAAARAEIMATSQKDQDEIALKLMRDEIASINKVEDSHPYQEPVTYDEATLQIWPNLVNAPALRVPLENEEPEPKVAPVKEEPQEEQIIEEAPVEEEPVVEEVQVEEAPVAETPIEEETKPVKVVEMSHPISKPVTYEEATKEIWPVLAKKQPAKKAPAKKEEKAKAPAKEQVKVEPAPQIKEEKPQPVKVVEMSHPSSEPVTYEEATLQIWPQIKDAPTLRKEEKKEEPKKAPVKKTAPKKEPAIKAEPVKEEKAPKAKPEKKAEKPAPIKKEPAKKAEPKPEPKKEQPKVEVKEPVKQEAPAPKVDEAPRTVVVEKPVPVRVEVIREKIPGRFIVKTAQGYYVSKDNYSINKDDANVFDDYNLAKDIKKELGGKIIKL